MLTEAGSNSGVDDKGKQRAKFDRKDSSENVKVLALK